MKTWNTFSRFGVSFIAILASIVIFSSRTAAQVTTLLASQPFSANALPSGWSANWGIDNQGAGEWFWSSNGQGGSNGSAVDDIWDYDYTPLVTPAVNVAAYANTTDSVWVDFDFFWENNCYTTGEDGALDEINIDANSDILVSGTEATIYTYYNQSDCNYDVVQTSPTYWQHYHILIPPKDRTSNMTVSWVFISGQGLSDIAVDNVTITGHYFPPPELSLTPKGTYNFGTATPNTPDTLYATVHSIGIAPLKITTATVSGSSAYSIVSGPANGTTVPVGNSVTYAVQFQPFTTGTLTGAFTVATTGADSGTQSISLTGIGAVPNVSYSATQMFRGVAIELTDTSAVQYLYVNSTGIGPLVVESINFIGLNANNYVITHRPSVIAPGGVDSIGVRFIPTIEGLPDAHMIINSSGVNDPWDTVGMFGEGILPHLQVSSTNAVSTPPNPLKVSFDSVNLGSDSCLNITVSNPGSDTLAVEKNFFANTDVDFSYTPLTGKDTLIPPGGSQTIQVCFDPVQQGFRTATLRLVTNIPHEETPAGLDTNTYDIVIIGTGVPGFGKLVVTGTGAYDTMAVGDTECFVDTIWNKGNAPITINSVVAATNTTFLAFFASDYPSVPFVLAPNSYQTVLVCAEPTTTFATGGLFWATATGGGVDSQQYAPLELTIAITKTILVPFTTETCMGDSDVASVVAYNLSTFPDTYTATITGANAADFTVTSPNPSPVVSEGSSTIVLIRFTPSTSGAESASLTIKRSSDGAVTGTIPLNASGSSATINGSGTAPTTAVGQTSAQFSATVSNTGSCEWTPGIPTVSAPFTYVSGGTTPIPPGGNKQIMFTFTPTSTGSASQAVNFPSQVGVSIPAANVTLNGVGAVDGVQPISASNGYSLGQTYPNPFNDESNLEITVAAPGLVQLSVVDVQGNVVEQVLNRQFDAGTYSVTLSAEGLASGTYYYQMSAGGVTLTRQMVIVK